MVSCCFVCVFDLKIRQQQKLIRGCETSSQYGQYVCDMCTVAVVLPKNV